MTGSTKPLRILTARLFDGRGEVTQGKLIIEVTGERLSRIIQSGSGDEANIDLDLSRLTILPALVEAHGHHSFSHFFGPIQPQVDSPLSERAALAATALEHRLASGVTLMRNPGERDSLGTTLKQLVVRGLLRGPDLVEAGLAVRSSAGHGIVATPVDGVENLRKVIRDNVRNGADFIKLFLSGAVSTGTDPNRCFYSKTEVEEAIDEAHRLGKTVSAHVYGGLPLEWALDAGLDVVEHGFLISSQQIEKMAKRSVKLVLTLGVIFNEDALKACLPAATINKLAPLREELQRVVREARQAGLKMAFGTDDNGLPPIGRRGAEDAEILDSPSMSLAREMRYAVEYLGFSPVETMVMATKHGAEICGLGDSYGTVEEGKLANLIGVRGNPLEDISALRQVAFVMKKGEVVRRPEG